MRERERESQAHPPVDVNSARERMREEEEPGRGDGGLRERSRNHIESKRSERGGERRVDLSSLRRESSSLFGGRTMTMM